MIQIPMKKPARPVGGIAQAGGTILGAIGGAFAGNPLAGASIGGTIGGLGGNAIDKSKEQAKPIQPLGQGDSMARRLSELQQGKERLNAIREGLMALPDVDPETRAKAAPILTQGYLSELQKRGMPQ